MEQVSFSSQTRSVLRSINVEPLLFLYCVFLSTFYSTAGPFYFFKCCFDSFSPSLNDGALNFCLNISRDNSTEDFNAIETRSAPLLQLLQVVLNVPACVASLIIGATSDRIGRKLPLVLALVDSLFGSFAYTFVAVFPRTSVYFMLTGSGLGSLMGGSTVVFLLAFSSVRDLNRDPTRYSLHLAVTSSTVALGIVTGSLTSSLLVSRLSYAWVFLSAQAAMSLAILYAVTAMRETYRLPSDMDEFAVNEDSPPGQFRQRITCQSVCDAIGINKVLKTVFLPRANRKSLLIALLTFQLVLISDQGLDNLILPYTKYPPLLWPDRYYGLFNALTSGLAAIGMTMWTLTVKKPFELADSTMIIGGLMFAAAKVGFYSLSKSTWQLFAAGSLSLFSTIYFPNFRSLVSGLVSREETGKIYSIISISESAAPLISAAVFNNIFLATLHVFPGLIFAIGSGLLCCCCLSVIYVHCLLKRAQKDEVPFLTQESIVDQSAACDT